MADDVVAIQQRDKEIVKTSVVGIVANVLLAAFKAVVGLLANSIAIVLDAVNNLSDALSSIITIVGTKLAGKAPDRKHPYGHGRVEYITTIVISVIVLWAGITSLQESVTRIIHPEAASYDTITLVIVAVAVVVKIVLGRYVKSRGVKLNSDSLVASGKDATMDAIISASTLVAAFIFIVWGVSLEAWLGAIISLVIVKAGVDILREALSKILGERVDSELSKAIKTTICSFPEVHGAYDLVLNDYGPDRLRGSVHVELDDTMNVVEIAELTRMIQLVVYEKHNVVINAVGVYSKNTEGGEVDRVRKVVEDIVWSHDHVLELHGFFANTVTKKGNFDVILAYDVPGENGRYKLYEQICQEVAEALPDYDFFIALDADVSD